MFMCALLAPPDAASFTMTDDTGALALRQEDEALTQAGAYRCWTSERAPVGDLHDRDGREMAEKARTGRSRLTET